MSDVTRILDAAAAGDTQAAAELFPLVYDELRRLANSQMAHEKPGHTLTATALVHEAFLRLVAPPKDKSAGTQEFANRRHFFAAAAEAMRRILVESARRKLRDKHGGGRQRLDLGDDVPDAGSTPDDLLAFDEALAALRQEDAAAAEIVQLHVFGGLSIEQVGELLGLSRATAYRLWSYARAWLRCQLAGEKAENQGKEPKSPQIP